MAAMKTDDRTTTILWALGAAAAVLVFAGVLVVEQNSGDDGSVSETELLREFFDSGFTPDEFDQLPADEGFVEFASFEEAEARAGYDIPRPSAEFVLRDGVTLLQMYSRQERQLTPLSSSEYRSADGDIVTVQVIPAEIGILDLRDVGDEKTIGSKQGWLLRQSDFAYFAWNCDVRSATDVYCLVGGFPGVDEATFERFVESLR